METTKDKEGALPPAVYTKQQDSTKVDLLAGLGNDFQPVGLSSDKGADCIVEVEVAEVQTYADEYDTDSEDDQFAPIFAWISKISLL